MEAGPAAQALADTVAPAGRLVAQAQAVMLETAATAAILSLPVPQLPVLAAVAVVAVTKLEARLPAAAGASAFWAKVRMALPLPADLLVVEAVPTEPLDRMPLAALALRVDYTAAVAVARLA